MPPTTFYGNQKQPLTILLFPTAWGSRNGAGSTSWPPRDSSRDSTVGTPSLLWEWYGSRSHYWEFVEFPLRHEVVYIQASLPSMLWSVPVISVTGVTRHRPKAARKKTHSPKKWTDALLERYKRTEPMKRGWWNNHGLSVDSELNLVEKRWKQSQSTFFKGRTGFKKKRSGVKCWNALKCLPPSQGLLIQGTS